MESRRQRTLRLPSNQIGEPIRYFERPWRAACKAAGIVNLRWHDLRHEHASRLVEKGVPLSQIHDLLGHASIAMTEGGTTISNRKH
jgi:integrase